MVLFARGSLVHILGDYPDGKEKDRDKLEDIHSEQDSNLTKGMQVLPCPSFTPESLYWGTIVAARRSLIVSMTAFID